MQSKIEYVMRHTTYTAEEAESQLKLHNMDETLTIQAFIKPPTPSINKRSRVNVNQEIFRQFRTMLDKSSKEYRDSHPIDIEDVIQHFANETNTHNT